MPTLEDILGKHKRRYDTSDHSDLECVCGNDSCEVIFVIEALRKSQKSEIVTLKDFKRESESFGKERRTLLAEIAGLENYIKKIEENKVPDITVIPRYFPVECPTCTSSKKTVRLSTRPGLIDSPFCENNWHDF